MGMVSIRIGAGANQSETQIQEIQDAKNTAVSAAEEAKSAAVENTNRIDTLLNEEINNALIPKRERRPIVTFVDDDGRKDVLTKWKPTLIEKKIPMTIPLVTSAIGVDPNYMTWDQVKEISDLGVEFCSHTHTHARLSDLTETQIVKEFTDSKEKLREHGYNDRLMIYPYGADSDVVRKKTREYFEAGIDVDEGVNYPPLSTFQLKRVTLAESTNNTLTYYKTVIDEAIANKGWIIFKSHSQYESFDAAQIQIIKDLIDYIVSKNVEIVNLSRGLRIFGNIMDIGDYPARAQGAEYTIMDVDGIMYSKTNQKNYTINNDTSAVGFTTPLSAFPERMGSLNLIIDANAGSFPEGKGGILSTFKFDINGNFAYQTYKLNVSNNTYTRTWNTGSSTWNAFISTSRAQDTLQIPMPAQTIPAGGTVDVTFDWSKTLATDIISATPNAILDTGVMYNVLVQAGKVIVRLYNTTANPITTVANRNWRFVRTPL